MMELERISDRTWHIACVLRPPGWRRGEGARPWAARPHPHYPSSESNALTGDGVDGGACWLADNIKRTRGK